MDYLGNAITHNYEGLYFQKYNTSDEYSQLNLISDSNFDLLSGLAVVTIDTEIALALKNDKLDLVLSVLNLRTMEVIFKSIIIIFSHWNNQTFLFSQ